jgi:serine/threonine protein kinase
MDPNVGELKHLRKLMLSHNKLTSIPAEIGGCKELELIRLANNEITVELPREFVSLPKLAWISLAGNPIAHCPQTKEKEILKSSVSYNDSAVLGRGASGTVYSGMYGGKNVAVKIFKQQSMGSDGNPEDEAAINALVDHPLAVSALGVFLCDEGENHEGMVSEVRVGLLILVILYVLIICSFCKVMELLEGAKAIGKVPSFQSVTRDAGPTDDSKDLDKEAVLSIVYNIALALEHVHTKANVSNGDIYLHNVLMCSGGVARISDWGASFIYDGEHEYAEVFERIEVLAFGRLVQDLFDWHLSLAMPDLTEPADFLGKKRVEPIEPGPFFNLMQSILQPEQMKRPSFKEIKDQLSQLPEFQEARLAATKFITSLEDDIA